MFERKKTQRYAKEKNLDTSIVQYTYSNITKEENKQSSAF